MIGVHVLSTYGIDIGNVSNITIKRCKIDYNIYSGYNNSYISIIGNFFFNPTANTGSAIVVSSYGSPVNFIFNNNICQRTMLLNNGSTIYSVFECKNNVFDYPALSAGNPSIRLLCNNFQNNILKTPGASVDVNNNILSSGVSFNISASATGQFGATNNNIVVTNQTTLFVTSSSADGKYQLKPLSPGSNNGSDGTNRGAFGGLSINNQYTLWSDPATWSNNKIPDANTVVLLYHNVTVNINATCKSLTPYGNNAACNVMTGKLLNINGKK